MNNEEKKEKELIERIEKLEILIKNESNDLEKGRDLGRKEWTNESIENLSYRPIKDETGTPPGGDDAEE